MSIQSDALVPILQTLITKHLKFVMLRGSKFRCRSARLVS
ncbi:hypothetical protein ABIF79_009945 [Bradyrhizobium japonicum]